MRNLPETFRRMFLRGYKDTKEFSDQLLSSERVFLQNLLNRFKDMHRYEFHKDVDASVLLTGGMVTRIHNKPPEDQDIDIAINFSSPIGSSERLRAVSLTETFLKGFFESNNLKYTQYAGLLEEGNSKVVESYRGWILVQREHEGQKQSVRGYSRSYPFIRFVTERTETLRSFEIMLWGVDHPNMEDQLKWQLKTGKDYKVIWDSRMVH